MTPLPLKQGQWQPDGTKSVRRVQGTHTCVIRCCTTLGRPASTMSGPSSSLSLVNRFRRASIATRHTCQFTAANERLFYDYSQHPDGIPQYYNLCTWKSTGQLACVTTCAEIHACAAQVQTVQSGGSRNSAGQQNASQDDYPMHLLITNAVLTS